jgi:hypothetical protein
LYLQKRNAGTHGVLMIAPMRRWLAIPAGPLQQKETQMVDEAAPASRNPREDTEKPQAFLDILFGESITPDRRVSIFVMPARQARFFDNGNAAADYAMARSTHCDVYYGVGLVAGEPQGRGSRSDIAAISGFFADIDFPSARRADKPLPRSIDDARTLWAPYGLEPTLIVHSGHGLHAYWLFKEPWVFETDEERDQASRLSKGWHGAICREGRKHGWQLENLGDIARVLRLPGTLNHSIPDEPVAVTVIEHHDGRRYNPEDFEPFAVEQQQPTSAVVEALHLDPRAKPPVDKFNSAFKSKLFQETWHRRREDLSDQSQSAYDLSLASMTGLMGWTDQEIADLLIAARRHHQEKPEKALRPDYVTRTIGLARSSAQNDSGEHVDLSLLLPDANAASGYLTLEELMLNYPALRPPILEGLLREGETMNLIAASKVGKSWLSLSLALAIASGRPWLDAFPTESGKVLIVDNELHPNTLAYRLPKVIAAMGVAFDDVADRIVVRCLRGQLKDLRALGAELTAFEAGEFKVVILDAFYRFLLKDTDENSNASMAELYNYVDAYADRLQCAFVIVHHSSKGNQSQKSVTDVGAGAGAQSRATDAHLVLRPHEEENVIVLEAAVRSWPPLEPRCLRWEFPLWLPADGHDPSELKQEKRRRKRPEPPVVMEDAPKPEWTPSRFVERFVARSAVLTAAILADANEEGLSDNKAQRLIAKAEAKGLIHPWRMEGNRRAYATVPQPEAEAASSTQTKRDRVEALLAERPDASSLIIAEKCGVTRRYVNEIRKQFFEVGTTSGNS